MEKKIVELNNTVSTSYLYNKDINPHEVSVGEHNPLQLVPGLNFVGLGADRFYKGYDQIDYDSAFIITGDIQKEVGVFKQKIAAAMKRDKKADEKQAVEAEKKAARHEIDRKKAIQEYQKEKENVLKERKTSRLASVKTKQEMLKKAKEFYSEARRPKDSSETKWQYESRRLQNYYNSYYLENAAKMCDLVGEPVPVTDKIGDIEKGEPMTFEQADSGNVNPHYDENIEDGFRTNCQTCEVVFMARMAGFDVEALPNKNNAVIDILQKSPLAAYIDKRTGFPPEVFLPSARETAGVLDWAANHFKPATLYAMIVDWKRKKEGHIAFLWKEDATGGGFRFKAYDSQTNKIYTNRGEVANFIINSVKDRTAFANLSDCVLNESVCKHIMKKRDL